ncbi:uncharacterized protein DUF2853 [Hasllibacter halocynthiae]|uniref:Uncharacterized protein DUF2853 n=1 Tax=Hasllibacter halocynthiae TaxID=595589 RepID=A0A2T0X2P3_9RHOB|nr:DUF2853 family protein [Hasllibacter halocynthiae]PRY93177.1 uncharacterized protein DUF2853 [Hasllibacter halocynthiae]
MSKREEHVEKYARDLREKVGIEPDLDLLREVTIACGPSIYRRDSETVSTSDTGELDAVRDDFLIGKLGLPDDEHLMGGIQQAIRTYGRDNRSKYRPVLYYLLVKHFGKEGAFR